jgi:hypothetical protein
MTSADDTLHLEVAGVAYLEKCSCVAMPSALKPDLFPWSRLSALVLGRWLVCGTTTARATPDPEDPTLSRVMVAPRCGRYLVLGQLNFRVAHGQLFEIHPRRAGLPPSSVRNIFEVSEVYPAIVALTLAPVWHLTILIEREHTLFVVPVIL